MEQLYTVPEVARMLKVTRAAVYNWMKTGQLEYVMVGSDRRVTAEAIAAFIRRSSRREPSEDEPDRNQNDTSQKEDHGSTIDGLKKSSRAMLVA